MKYPKVSLIKFRQRFFCVRVYIKNNLSDCIGLIEYFNGTVYSNNYDDYIKNNYEFITIGAQFKTYEQAMYFRKLVRGD